MIPLSLRPGYQFVAQATGSPVNGNNTFTLPWGSNQGLSVSGDELEIEVVSNGSSVTGVSFVSYTRGINDSQCVISVNQTGTDSVTVIVTYVHSLVR